MNKVDTILTNAIVLTMDEEFNLYEPGAVAVKGDSIVAVGPAEEISGTYTAKETIDCCRQGADARSDQCPYARTDDTAPRLSR